MPVALAHCSRRDQFRQGQGQAGCQGSGAPGGCLTRGGQLGLAADRLGGYPSYPHYKYTGRVNTWEEEKNSYFS